MVAVLFAVSGLLAITGQVRITAWCRRRWGRGRCLTNGLALMGAAFLPGLAVPVLAAERGGIPGTALAVAPLVLAAALLSLGTIIVFPFEMDTIVMLAGERLVATHYGLYSTVCGVGILLGNLLTGGALDLARSIGLEALPWLVLTAVGLACAAAVRQLDRAGGLDPAPRGTSPVAA